MSCTLSEMRDKNKSYKVSVHIIFRNMKADLVEYVDILIVEVKS